MDGSPVTAQKQLADQPAAPLQPNKSEEPDPKNAISPVKNEQLRSPRYSNKDIFHVLDDLIRFLEQQELACKDRSYKNAQW
ncbi:hypothetical protein [Endozoicomonas sp.]|uniref:hypothetical protein n=1 Tax=Endozoicomonas sp. TaxID=1892382 RepID=UPI002885F53F|nr:hypothetical protein [Endozoicomonas sp.]